MKLAICDDEQKDLQHLKNLILDYDAKRTFNIYEYSNADDFLRDCNDIGFDIAFLDIEMKGTNGYEAAKLLSIHEKRPLMFFVTNTLKYSIQGYGLVYRYLTKPLSFKLLTEALYSAVREVNVNRYTFTVDDKRHVIGINDIYYFEIYNHTTVLHTMDQTFSMRATLKEVMSQLPRGYFGMPHQSYVVNFSHVNTSSAAGVSMTNGAVIPVSRRKFHDFSCSLQMYLGR